MNNHSEIDTPDRIKERLGERSPTRIWIAGNPEILKTERATAVVGARNADRSLIKIAEKIGEAAAQSAHTLVSGAAKGIDERAMLTTLETGGKSIGVIPGDLEREARSVRWRRWIEEGALTLITPYEPDGRFTVGKAMGRNRYIYCLADVAIALGAKRDSGGTWSGAKENLRKEWTPLYVEETDDRTSGANALIELGARRLPQDIESLLIEWSKS